MSNGTNTASVSLLPESQTDTCPSRPSSLTCVSSFSPVQPSSTEALRTWLVLVFPASRSASPESNRRKTTSGTCGPQHGTLFAQYSLNPFCLKTSLDLFPAVISEPSSLTWPRWGMWGDGGLLELPTAMPRTSGTGCGSWPTPAAAALTNSLTLTCSGDGRKKPNKLGWAVAMWPTPLANDAEKRGNIANDRRNGLSAAARYWPTPTAHNAKECAAPSEFNRNTPTLAAQASGGQPTQPMILNPEWVEWLQGWPMGWTDLKPLAMGRFLPWLHAHGGS